MFQISKFTILKEVILQVLIKLQKRSGKITRIIFYSIGSENGKEKLTLTNSRLFSTFVLSAVKIECKKSKSTFPFRI